MCADEAGVKGTGCVKGVGVALLVWSILELDIFGIILSAIVVCSCCGPAHSMKKCLIIFTAILLVLELVGLCVCIAIGAQWLDAASKCKDTMNCVAGSCSTTATCDLAKAGMSSRMLEASPAGANNAEFDASPVLKLFSSNAHRILFPISTTLIYGFPSSATYMVEPATSTTQGRALSDCSTFCSSAQLGDSTCDIFCNNEACNYDNGDCQNSGLGSIFAGDRCCAFTTVGSDSGPHCWTTTNTDATILCDFFQLIGNIILAIGLITCLLSVLLMSLLLCGLCKMESSSSPKA